MISKLPMERIDDISDLLESLTQSFPLENRPPRSFLDIIKEAVENGNAEVLVSQTKGDAITGFLSIGLVSNSISLLYSSKDDNERKSLFKAGFEKLRDTGKPIRFAGPWVTDELSEYAVSMGFRKFDRKFMTADKETLMEFNPKILAEEYVVELYTDEMKGTVADLIYRANESNIDVMVFPHFFGTIEACERLIDNTKNNHYGQWKDNISKVLIHDEKVIGVCLLTLRGNYGYIPDISIDPDYRRRGLGRYLLVRSLQDLLRSDKQLTGISLDVTLENPARFLYESLGFKDVRKYSMYTWFPNS